MGLQYFVLIKSEKSPEQIETEFIKLFNLSKAKEYNSLLGKYYNFSIRENYDEDYDLDENGDDITAACICPGATIQIWVYSNDREYPDIALDERDRALMVILNHYPGNFGVFLASTDAIIMVRRNDILYYNDRGIDVEIIRASGYDMSRVVKGIPPEYKL